MASAPERRLPGAARRRPRGDLRAVMARQARDEWSTWSATNQRITQQLMARGCSHAAASALANFFYPCPHDGWNF